MRKYIWLIISVILISGCCLGGVKTARINPSLSAIDLKKSIGGVNLDTNFEFNCCLKGKAKEQVEQLEAKMIKAYNEYDAGSINADKLKEKLAIADSICQKIKSHYCDNKSSTEMSTKSIDIKGLDVVKEIDTDISEL